MERLGNHEEKLNPRNIIEQYTNTLELQLNWQNIERFIYRPTLDQDLSMALNGAEKHKLYFFDQNGLKVEAITDDLKKRLISVSTPNSTPDNPRNGVIFG